MVKINKKDLKKFVKKTILNIINETKKSKNVNNKDKEELKKGVDGYQMDEVKPRGFGYFDSYDFKFPNPTGSRLKKQGVSNLGGYTGANFDEFVEGVFNVQQQKKKGKKSR